MDRAWSPVSSECVQAIYGKSIQVEYCGWPKPEVTFRLRDIGFDHLLQPSGLKQRVACFELGPILFGKQNFRCVGFAVSQCMAVVATHFSFLSFSACSSIMARVMRSFSNPALP